MFDNACKGRLNVQLKIESGVAAETNSGPSQLFIQHPVDYCSMGKKNVNQAKMNEAKQGIQ